RSGGQDGGGGRSDLERFLPGVDVVLTPRRRGSKRLAQGRSVLSHRSWLFGQYGRDQMSEALAETVASRRPSVVHFDDLGVAQLGPVPGVLNAYCAHNVEHDNLHQEAETTPGLRRAFARTEYRNSR